MLGMCAIVFGAQNVYSANHDDQPTLRYELSCKITTGIYVKHVKVGVSLLFNEPNYLHRNRLKFCERWSCLPFYLTHTIIQRIIIRIHLL